jgi:hypothetical protein
MNGIDNHFADNAKRLRRELVELKEMVRLGAGLPGDEHRIEMAKCLLTQWHVLCERRAENHAETHERPAEVRLDFGGRTKDVTMMDLDTEWQIGETMAEVLRERLVELETLEATGDATEDTASKLAFVRKLLIRFDARDTPRRQELAKRLPLG